MSAGQDIPARVVAAFDVWPHLAVYDRAFRRLDVGRTWHGTMGGTFPQPISEQEKAAYASARLGLALPSAEYERFCRMIEAQDEVFLAWHAERSKSAESAGGADDAAHDNGHGGDEDEA